MAKKTKLDTIVAELEQQRKEKDALATMLAAAGARTAVPNSSLYVGIRNVSSYTIGLPASPVPGEAVLTLAPALPGSSTPDEVAVVTFAWWQQLRKGKHFRDGMIARDDTVLGSSHPAAPADRPEELAPQHDKNIVRDPREFIVGKSEAELRAAISAMTSGPSLRRLWQAVSDEVARVRETLSENLEPRLREEKAVHGISGAFQLTEQLVIARLDELGPKQEA